MASKMTNEELANLIERGCGTSLMGHAIREAAARLRKIDKFAAINERQDIDNAELRRRLKVAEDALTTIENCDTDGIVLNFEETQIVNGHDLAIEAVNAVDKARNALAAIREPVTDCNQLEGGYDAH